MSARHHDDQDAARFETPVFAADGKAYRVRVLSAGRTADQGNRAAVTADDFERALEESMARRA